MDEIIEALCNCPFFIGIDKKVVRDNLMTAKYQIKQYDKNEFICREDQSSIYIGIIISGCIEIKKIFSSVIMFAYFIEIKGTCSVVQLFFPVMLCIPAKFFQGAKAKLCFLIKIVFLKCVKIL